MAKFGMNLENYIKHNYNGDDFWFVEECKKFYHVSRTNKILDYKEYLAGKHVILERPNEYWNGRVYQSRKICLQMAKTVLDFQANYLLSKPVTITGEQDIVDIVNKIYKKGKYDRIDYELLDSVIKYGVAYEYVTYEDGIIQSRVLDPADCYPVYNSHMELIALIEHWIVDGISHWRVYDEDEVVYYEDREGKVWFMGAFPSVGGLPIVYKSNNSIDSTAGRSELEDIIPLIDNMELLISQQIDAAFYYHKGIPVVIGQQLKGDGLPTDVVTGGIVLDDGSDFKFVSNQIETKAFESAYQTLRQALLDISSTPAVSLNSQDVSNLSEVSIKLLFSLADVKAGLNEKYMRQGIEQRFERIRNILALQGIAIDDDSFDTLDVVFSYARPRNEQDIINDIKTLREIQAISLESALSHSPYTSDVYQELERIKAEGTGAEE